MDMLAAGAGRRGAQVTSLRPWDEETGCVATRAERSGPIGGFSCFLWEGHLSRLVPCIIAIAYWNLPSDCCLSSLPSILPSFSPPRLDPASVGHISLSLTSGPY